MGRDAIAAGSLRAPCSPRGGSSFAGGHAMLGPFDAFPPGCSSDWQSAAFGTQKSLVQIQSPRLSFPSRSVRLALVGGVVAATVGGGASPSGAESVTARGDEVVAREAPGKGQAGIAVLRGTDRVQLLGERDGWSEIRLPDGRRAWVPAGEIARSEEPPEAKPSQLEPVMATASPASETAEDPSLELEAEITRLKSLVDELEARRSEGPATPIGVGGPLPEGFVWMVGGAALLVGIFVGSAWERRRGRRDRSLRF